MTCGQWLAAVSRHCGQPARPYPCGPRCTAHTPAAQAGIPEPPTTPMETR